MGSLCVRRSWNAFFSFLLSFLWIRSQIAGAEANGIKAKKNQNENWRYSLSAQLNTYYFNKNNNNKREYYIGRYRKNQRKVSTLLCNHLGFIKRTLPFNEPGLIAVHSNVLALVFAILYCSMRRCDVNVRVLNRVSCVSHNPMNRVWFGQIEILSGLVLYFMYCRFHSYFYYLYTNAISRRVHNNVSHVIRLLCTWRLNRK